MTKRVCRGIPQVPSPWVKAMGPERNRKWENSVKRCWGGAECEVLNTEKKVATQGGAEVRLSIHPFSNGCCTSVTHLLRMEADIGKFYMEIIMKILEKTEN